MFEQYCAAHLNKIGCSVQKFSAGNHTEVTVDIRLLMQAIISQNTKSIVLAHFHPTGSAMPSSNDKRTTRRIALLCRTMGVALIDHIIFSQYDYFSFRQDGYL